MKISEIKSYIEKSDGLAIEIAGPTLNGYDFIKENHIKMPTKLVVTNISQEIEVWDREKDSMILTTVDEVADIRNLPYESNSISLILVSNLSITPGDDMEAVRVAMHEYESPLDPSTNLHLFLYKEAYRVLMPNGLIIQIGAFTEDMSALSKYSFVKEYESTENESTLILRKNSEFVH